MIFHLCMVSSNRSEGCHGYHAEGVWYVVATRASRVVRSGVARGHLIDFILLLTDIVLLLTV